MTAFFYYSRNSFGQWSPNLAKDRPNSKGAEGAVKVLSPVYEVDPNATLSDLMKLYPAPGEDRPPPGPPPAKAATSPQGPRRAFVQTGPNWLTLTLEGILSSEIDFSLTRGESESMAAYARRLIPKDAEVIFIGGEIRN